MSRIFRQFGLDDGVVSQLPERFESRFKAVQREQTKSDDIVLATDKKLLEAKRYTAAQVKSSRTGSAPASNPRAASRYISAKTGKDISLPNS